MTHDEAVSRIRIYIGGKADGTGRSDIDNPLISSMLNERIKMLAVPFKFASHEASGTFNTVADTDTIAVPSSVYAIERIVDEDNNSELELVDFDYYTNESSYATGLPRRASFYGSNVYISPTPTDAYTLRWYGFALPSDISGSTELPFPEDWHPLLCKYTASDILFMKGNHERGMLLKNEALGDLDTRVEPRTFQRRRQVGQIAVARPIMNRRSGLGRHSRDDYNGW